MKDNMKICEFCIEMRPDGRCNYGLSDPRGMSCKYFNTNLGKFCANPDDFVDAAQIVAMASFFHFKRSAMKKIALMAKRETEIRALPLQ